MEGGALDVTKFVQQVQRQDDAREPGASTSIAKPRGRPPLYSPALAEEVLRRMEGGENISDICADPAMPSWPTLIKWRRTNEDFSTQYARARQSSAEALEYRALDEAYRATPENAHAARLVVDTIKWSAAKRDPAKYADKQLHTGPDGQSPIQVQHSYQLDRLEPHELAEFQRLLHKCRAPTIEG
jgi:hypothetical protein